MAQLPLQPLCRDQHGTIRFQENKIVAFLVEWARDRGMSLNDLARLPFPDQDREQLAQLIGYSLGGFSELSYVSSQTYARAEEAAKGLESPAPLDPAPAHG